MKTEAMVISDSRIVRVMPQKLRGAILTMETAFYIIFIIIIAAIAISTLMDTDSAKHATTTQEVEQIRTAAVKYKAFSKTGDVTFSNGFTELFTTLTTANSVDAKEHGPFLSPDSINDDGRWTVSGGATDLWGNPYYYDETTHEIYSTCGGQTNKADQVRAFIGKNYGQ